MDDNKPEMPKNELELRRILANVYGGALLYRDDGELQDSQCHPFIDFLRDTPEEIQNKMITRARNAIEAELRDLKNKG